MDREIYLENIFEFWSYGWLITFTAPPVGLIDGQDYDLTKGIYKGIKFPVVFKQSDGKKFRDMLETGNVSLYLISDRFKEILKKEHFTGWQSYPIELYDKKGNKIDGYHGLSITGRCGAPDYSHGKMVKKRMIENGPICRDFIGYHVYKEGWDGSDFFIKGDGLGILVTGRVAKTLKEHKLTNIHLEDIKDIEIPDHYLKWRLKRHPDMALPPGFFEEVGDEI